MKNSFLEDSLQLRTATTNGAGHKSSKLQCRKDTINLFFTTRPKSDVALLSELNEDLIPTALASCSARSAQLALLLGELIRIVMHHRPQESGSIIEASPWHKALYVILRTSLVREAKLMVPRLYLSPDIVRIAESIGTAQQNLQVWSGELDPVLSALVNVNGATSDSVVIIQQFGRRGFADSSFSDASSCCSSIGAQTCGLWNMDVIDVVAEDEAMIKHYEHQNESLFCSPLIEDSRQRLVGPPRTARQRNESGDNASSHTNFLRPGVEFFRMCVGVKSGQSEHEVGIFLVAAHFVISGSPDPFGVVIYSRTETIGGTSLPRLIVHPDLIASPPNFTHYSAAMFGVRGMVSLLESAAEWGNVFCALRAIVKRSDSHDVIAAIGTIGIAAVKALQEVLQYLTKEVALSQTLVGQRVAAISPREVLQVWTRRLVPITDTVATLADTFAVNINDKTWSSSKSLNQCGSTQFLTRLYRQVTQQNPAQYAAKSLSLWRQGKPFACRDNLNGDSLALHPLELIAYLFACGMAPFCAMLKHWLLTGGVAGVDPFDEFFIVPSYGETSSGYRVDVERLPCFVSPATAENILSAGVARSVFLDVLKQVQRNISIALSSQGQSSDGVFAWAREQWVQQFDTAHERVISSKGIPALLLGPSDSSSDAVAKWESYLLFCVEPLIDELRWSGVLKNVLNNADDHVGTLNTTATLDIEDKSSVLSSRSSVEVQAPSSVSNSQRSHYNASKPRDFSVGFSESGEPFRTFSLTEEANADLRMQAAAILEAEHAAKMKILKFQESMLRWRTRRLGLKLRRAVARRDELEFIKAMHAAHPAHGNDRDRLTPVGIFVIPLKNDFPCAPQSDPEPLLATEEDGEQSPQLSVRLSLADDLADETQLMKDDLENEDFINCRPSLELEDNPFAVEHESNEYPVDCDAIQQEGDHEAPLPSINNLASVFAPIPLSQEEYLEAQCVGVSSSHYHHLRVKHAVEEYDARENLLQETNNELSDLDHYLRVVCAKGCRTAAFQNTSSWAQTISEDRQWQQELEGKEGESDAETSTPTSVLGLSSLQRGRHVDNVLQYKSYIHDLAITCVSATVPRTLFFLLSPSFGIASHLAQSLRHVCLLQGSSETTSAFFQWELAAFSSEERSRHPSLMGIYDIMREGFSRMWSNAWTRSMNQPRGFDSSAISGLPARCPLALHLSVSRAGLEQCESRPTATPFDLLPLISVTFSSEDSVSEVSSEGLDEYLLLLPPHAAKRYSDLFVSLVFWRWAQRALDVCWSSGVAARSARHHHREIWLFCTLARSVISVVVEHVWYGVAQACKLFDTQSEDRVAIAGMTNLDDFISLHDIFLSLAYDAALLGPQYSRARQQIRIMVQLVERVFHFLSSTPKIKDTGKQLSNDVVHLQNVQRKQLLQHAREFWSATDMFVKHLTETVEASAVHDRRTSCKPILDMIARISIALASCRLS
jgi:hypothetical protein